MQLSLRKDLTPLRAAAEAAIDAEAGRIRATIITIAPGQDMVYLQKRSEAETYVAAPATPQAELPHLVAEANAFGVTLIEQAQVILTLAHQWGAISAQIETVRLTAKAHVATSTSPAAIQAIVTAAIAELQG